MFSLMTILVLSGDVDSRRCMIYRVPNQTPPDASLEGIGMRNFFLLQINSLETIIRKSLFSNEKEFCRNY